MTSLLKCSTNGLSGSSSEAVAEGAGRTTGEMASGEGARRDPEVVAIARRRQFSGSEKRRLLAEAERMQRRRVRPCRAPDSLALRCDVPASSRNKITDVRIKQPGMTRCNREDCDLLK
jgi:hypothetical protein